MTKKILIIEDDKILAETLQTTLNNTGQFETALATDGATGLRLADEFNPDMIILDVLLPEITGLDMLAKWNENGLVKRIPVTVASNLDQFEIINRALTLGARYYFLKSEVSPADIVKHLQLVLGGDIPPVHIVAST